MYETLRFAGLSVAIDYVRAELIRLDESLRLQVCRRVRKGRGEEGGLEGPAGKQSCSASLLPQHIVPVYI